MPDPKKGAIDEASPASNNGANGSDSPAGKTADVLLEELRAENKRKADEISGLKSEKSKLEALKAEYEERLTELDNKRTLTASDREEKKVLAAKIRQVAEAQPYLYAAEEIAEEKANSAMWNIELEKANDFLDDKAEELGLESGEELAKKIASYAVKYSDKRPSRRNELAFRDYMKAESREKDLQKKEADLKKKEAEYSAYAEGSGRTVRDPGLADRLNSAKTKDDKLALVMELQNGGPAPR